MGNGLKNMRIKRLKNSRLGCIYVETAVRISQFLAGGKAWTSPGARVASNFLK
jgi:hypothetical protein